MQLQIFNIVLLACANVDLYNLTILVNKEIFQKPAVALTLTLTFVDLDIGWTMPSIEFE